VPSLSRMKLLENIAQLATCRAEGGQGEIHAIADAALVWEGETIRWVGPRRELPSAYAGAERLDAGGGLVIPGLVDCHTHLAFGGWRADEFEQRILGHSYLEIAAAGGGIARTMRLTRAASEAELVDRTAGFLREMLSLGVTTVECKSGYGLNREHELRLLRVYRTLAGAQPVRLVPTFLGAHVVPPELRTSHSMSFSSTPPAAEPRAASGFARARISLMPCSWRPRTECVRGPIAGSVPIRVSSAATIEDKSAPVRRREVKVAPRFSRLAAGSFPDRTAMSADSASAAGRSFRASAIPAASAAKPEYEASGVPASGVVSSSGSAPAVSSAASSAHCLPSPPIQRLVSTGFAS